MKKAKKLVYGVGINDADYVVRVYETIGYVNGRQKQKLVWACPYYRKWQDMIGRCYSDNYRDKYPTYNGCSVSEEWLTFSNFKRWMEKQDWEGKQLDKDLLIVGNRVYCEDACVFVKGSLNKFLTDSRASRGEWPIGVHWDKSSGKFKAQCGNPITNKREHLGLFTCHQEAHYAWLKRKLELAHLLAEEQTDERVSNALIERYEDMRTPDFNIWEIGGKFMNVSRIGEFEQKSYKDMTEVEVEDYCKMKVMKYAAQLKKWEEKLKIIRLMNHKDKSDE